LKKLFFAVFLSAALAAPAAAGERLRVVATTTLYADLVRQIGGGRVEVKHVAPPRFNVHFVQPRPSDVRNVRKADLYVHAGLDLEAWSDPLLEAAGKPDLFRGGPGNADLSANVRLLEVPEGPLSRHEGDIHAFGNPHFHMNPENARAMAATLVEKLKERDAEGAEAYEANAAAFLAKLEAKIVEWKAAAAPLAGRQIVSYHKDIAYFADFTGVRCELFLEPKPGIPPTPKHLAALEAAMRERGVKAIVMPTYYPREVADAVGRRTGARVAIVAQSAGEVPGTEDFFSFFDYNIKTLTEALGS
jgi:zinc/manganese transport system substrate-binding protein